LSVKTVVVKGFLIYCGFVPASKTAEERILLLMIGGFSCEESFGGDDSI
jgi:hypothetical protein